MKVFLNYTYCMILNRIIILTRNCLFFYEKTINFKKNLYQTSKFTRMKFLKTVVFLSVVMFISTQSFAQKFIIPTHTYSGKKVSYVTLQDGTKLEGKVSKLYYKKSQIKAIKLKMADGKKQKIEAEKIKYMYLKPSGFDKFGKLNSFLNDATQWRDNDLDKDILKQGYVYLEQTKVKIKKKTRTLIMQVLNPTFCGTIRVFYNPFAGRTTGIGVAGIKVAGGRAKSYYIKKKDGVAFVLRKKRYKNKFNEVFGDCEAVKKKYAENIKWKDLANQVFDYDKECGKK